MARILSVTPYKYTPPENGGHQGVIIVDRILHEHNDVLNLSTDNNSVVQNPLEIETSFTIPSTVWRYFPYRLTKLIDRKIKEFSATHLFIHHHYLFPSAFRAAKKNKIPLYIRSHNIESERFRSLKKKWWRLMYFFEKLAYKKADKIFFVTEEDKAWAIHHYAISPEKCIVMPFGIHMKSQQENREEIKKLSGEDLRIDPLTPWIFFMGKLDYTPNETAVESIVNEIYPALKSKQANCQLIIFGKNLKEDLVQKIQKLNAQNHDIHYLGFVPHIENLLVSCDIMLNPVNQGGGVKTKVIESIAWNNSVISSHTGATGIEKNICGDKLILVSDHNWTEYADAIIKHTQISPTETPQSFYDYYSLEKIADRMQSHF